MSDEVEIAWDTAEIEWTQEGYRLSLTLNGVIENPWYIAEIVHLTTHYLRGLYRRDVAVSYHDSKLTITSTALLDGDAEDVRRNVDLGVRNGIQLGQSNLPRDRDAIARWLSRLRGDV